MANMRDKTRIPQTHKKVLPRKHITQILDAVSMDDVVSVVAPYGYGKTTAVISWLRDRGRRAAWLTLDETDNHEAAFVEGLMAAILPFASAREDIDFFSPKTAGDARAFLPDAASRLAGGSISADTVVIDNFHWLSDAGLLRAVKDFIGALLGHVRVILISRAELPPFFNDLILKKHIRLITAKELNFGMDEMAEYFSANGHEVPRQNLERIYDGTEGWAAALNVILTVSRVDPIEYGEEARACIMGFLETEIWAGLNENSRAFLLRTAVLDKLTPFTCRALTGIGETLPTLMWLFANGLFISRLERDTYVYHRVFKDFLLGKLDAFDIEKRELYKKAGWWHYENREYEQAFPYFFKAGELYGLSRILKKISPATMGLERHGALVSHITTIDFEDLRAYPYIAARIGLYHYTFGEIEKMQQIYDMLLDWNRSGVLQLSQEDYAEYMWEFGLLGYLNPNEPVENNERHVEWLNFTQMNPDLREQYYLRVAVIRGHSLLNGIRDYCPALRAIEEAMATENVPDNYVLRNNLALLQLAIIRAEYAYELEDFEKAERIIQAAMAETEKRNLMDLYFICMVVLTNITRAVRGSKGIRQMEKRMETMIEARCCDYLWPRFYTYQQRNRLKEGFIGKTEAFAAETTDYIKKPYVYTVAIHTALARTLLSTKDYQEALMLLGTLEEICHKYKRIRMLMEVYILQAVADCGLGREDSACRRLTEAIELAREYGFIRVFSDEAKDIWPILALVRKQRNDTYIRKIVISCKKTLARAGVRLTDKPDELTKTELKILKSLQASMSYEEIALDNGVKVSTVKSHVHSIYSKLQVNNRTSAVIAAQNAGILE